MKATSADYDLADRFPKDPIDHWKHGKTPGDAKVSPTQLARLLQLNLIKLAPCSQDTGGVAGYDALKNPGKGHGRRNTHFLRTYATRPT